MLNLVSREQVVVLPGRVVPHRPDLEILPSVDVLLAQLDVVKPLLEREGVYYTIGENKGFRCDGDGKRWWWRRLIFAKGEAARVQELLDSVEGVGLDPDPSPSRL